MKNALLSLAAISAAVLLVACGGPKKCTSQADCSSGQVCSAGTCVAGTGGGAGGGSGGGSVGGGGGGSVGGGTGGSVGGGTGGGSAGGGTGGGSGPGGETCGSATVVANGTSGTFTTVGAANDYAVPAGGVCKSTAPAPDTVFSVEVAAGNRLRVSVTTPLGDGGWDAVVNLVESPASNCGTTGADGGTEGATCLAGADLVASGTENVAYGNTTGTSKTVYIVIDGFDLTDEGSFDMSVATEPIPAGDVCANAPAITSSQNLTGQTIANFAGDYGLGAGCASSGFFTDRVYKVTVPAGQRLSATVTPDSVTSPDGGTGVGFNPSLSVVVTPTCGTTLTCVASSNGTAMADPETVAWDNFGNASKDVFLVVDTSTSAPTGTFTLNVALAATPTVPAGDVCDNAGAAITADATRNNESFATYSNNYSSYVQQLCRYQAGPDKAYAVDIPAGQIMRARAQTTGPTPDAGIDLTLSLVPGGNECGSGPCVAGSDSTTFGVEEIRQANTGAAPARYYVVVDSRSTTPDAGYNFAVQFSAIPAGDRCETATTPITATTTLATESLEPFSSDYGPATTSTGCRLASGPDKAYAIDIPAGQRMTAVATSTGDLGLSVIDGPAANCSAASVTCSASADANATGAETVMVNNTGTGTKRVYLVVDRFGQPAVGETFSLAITLGAAPAGETCAAPTAITASGTLSNQTLVGFTNEIGTSSATGSDCTGYSNSGPDRVYSVAVNAAQRLTVTVLPTGTTSWDPAVYLLPTPATNCRPTDSMCVTGCSLVDGGTITDNQCGQDNGAGGTSESFTWVNNTGAAATVFLVVDCWSSSASVGTYDLQVQLQ